MYMNALYYHHRHTCQWRYAQLPQLRIWPIILHSQLWVTDVCPRAGRVPSGLLKEEGSMSAPNFEKRIERGQPFAVLSSPLSEGRTPNLSARESMLSSRDPLTRF